MRVAIACVKASIKGVEAALYTGFHGKQLRVDFVEMPVSAALPEAREQKYWRICKLDQN